MIASRHAPVVSPLRVGLFRLSAPIAFPRAALRAGAHHCFAFARSQALTLMRASSNSLS
jgi:hypothetical protein